MRRRKCVDKRMAYNYDSVFVAFGKRVLVYSTEGVSSLGNRIWVKIRIFTYLAEKCCLCWELKEKIF